MGKKKNKSCLSKFLIYTLSGAYATSNILMLVMVIFRIISFSIDKSIVNKTVFPY